MGSKTLQTIPLDNNTIHLLHHRIRYLKLIMLLILTSASLCNPLGPTEESNSAVNLKFLAKSPIPIAPPNSASVAKNLTLLFFNIPLSHLLYSNYKINCKKINTLQNIRNREARFSFQLIFLLQS